MKIIYLCISLLIMGCGTQPIHSHQELNNDSKSNPQPHSVIKKTNFIMSDDIQSKNIDGELVLTKHNNHCQLDKVFLYPDQLNVIYRYTFKNNKLISASTIMPDERDNLKLTSTWNDPEYTQTIESFIAAKQFFSDAELKQCNFT